LAEQDAGGPSELKAPFAQSLAPDPACLAAREKPWLIDMSAYDRSPALHRHEVQHLAELVPRIGRRLPWLEDALEGLGRLQRPIMDVMAATDASLESRRRTLAVLLFEMHGAKSYVLRELPFDGGTRTSRSWFGTPL